MQTMSAISNHEPVNMPPEGIDNIIDKLQHYRQQSEQLALINQLHSRLAGTVDLQSIIEAFSVWLMPLVEHDLVAYRHPDKEKSHLLCSCHGPVRREVISLTEDLFERAAMDQSMCDREINGYFVRCWQLADRENRHQQLFLLHKDAEIPVEKQQLVEGAVAVVEGPLQRAIYYEQLVELASKDALTGLANRRVFEGRIGFFLERARRHGVPLTLASMDLDNFKKINDSMGHAEGDRVLQEVARVFAGTVRGSDLLVRMGGDEFFLVLPDTDHEAALNLAERLCNKVATMDFRTPRGERLGVSIGLTTWQKDLSKEAWIQQADEALYQAKAGGRSQVCTSDAISVDRARNFI